MKKKDIMFIFSIISAKIKFYKNKSENFLRKLFRQTKAQSATGTHFFQKTLKVSQACIEYVKTIGRLLFVVIEDFAAKLFKPQEELFFPTEYEVGEPLKGNIPVVISTPKAQRFTLQTQVLATPPTPSPKKPDRFLDR